MKGWKIESRVYTKPEEFENAGLFLWLVLSSTLRHGNGAFQKRSPNKRNQWRRRVFFFPCWRDEYFWRRWRRNNHVIFLTEFSSKMIAIVAFLYFFAFSLHFQSETSVFRFLRRSKFKMEVPRLFGWALPGQCKCHYSYVNSGLRHWAYKWSRAHFLLKWYKAIIN